MVTSEQLKSIMSGLPAARNTEFFPFLVAAMTEFAIEAPARMAAFLAQLAHESAQLRFMQEIWGPTPAQRRYEPPATLAATLGNTEAGDGLRFKGRGPIQITGRANYQRFGGLLNMDLVATPERAAQPDVAFRVAGLFWSKKGLNELADQATPDAFREITRRINGGFNGLAERQQFYAVARTVLGVKDVPVVRGAAPARPVPVVPEPDFPRGHESIQADVPPLRSRETTPVKRRPASVKRRSTTGTKRRPASVKRRPKTGTKRTPKPARARAKKPKR